MDQEALAKEALILKLFRGYPGADKGVSAAVVQEYLEAISSFHVEVIAKTIKMFKDGGVERDARNKPFVPSVEELTTKIRQVQFQEGKIQRFVSHGLKMIDEREADDHIFKTRTPEQIAKVRRLMDEAKANLAPDVRDEKEQAEIRELLKRADQLFEADYFVTDDGRKVSISLAKQHGIEPYNMEDEEGDIR